MNTSAEARVIASFTFIVALLFGFASWTGTAPIEASSGEQVRHRLRATLFLNATWPCRSKVQSGPRSATSQWPQRGAVALHGAARSR
jgi:hypothetical protein